jgi:hypothetical protein
MQPIPRLITTVCAAPVAAIALAHFITSGSAALLPSPPAQAAAPSGVPTSSAESPPLEKLPATPADFPWLFTYRDGLPARWPCGPIGYRLVTEGAPEGAQDSLADAVGRTSAVSGLQFRQDPPVASAGAYQGIEVSWVSSAALGSPDPTAIGLGGASATDGHYTTGYVKISEDCSGSARLDFSPDGIGPVLLHELGHALGLSHTDDLKAIMYPSDQGNSEWTPAERAALRYLHQTC